MLPSKLAFVDVETTGFRSSYDRVIEVGILRVENNTLVQTYSSLINPGLLLQPEITTLTGITSADLENAPNFRLIKDDLLEILKDCILVAHNARFDYSFLKNEFKRLGVTFSPKQLCSVKLSRQLFPNVRHHNLSAIIDRFEIECKNRHRAFDDAKVIWDFFQIIQKEFEPEKIEKAINTIFKRPSLPINLPTKMFESLPEGPGVYIFYGENGAPLYVGKSINIRTRVLSHFSSDHSSSKEMKISQQIKSIETIPTVGELGALLKESYLIKKMQPLYNRMQRYSHKLIVAQRELRADGYEGITLETLSDIPVDGLSRILGVFKNQRSAKGFLIDLAKRHSLCEKLLGLEKTSGACFGYRLGRCLGACVGKEKNFKYNLRFFEAFSQNQIKPWPFDGAIVIKEENPLAEESEGFLIHNWCYLGNLSLGKDILKSEYNQSLKFSSDEKYNFDLDTYKILFRYIRNPNNKRNIKLIQTKDLMSLNIKLNNLPLVNS